MNNLVISILLMIIFRYYQKISAENSKGILNIYTHKVEQHSSRFSNILFLLSICYFVYCMICWFI